MIPMEEADELKHSLANTKERLAAALEEAMEASAEANGAPAGFKWPLPCLTTAPHSPHKGSKGSGRSYAPRSAT